MSHKDPVAHKTYNHQWYLDNRDRVHAMSREWRAKNRTKHRLQRRDYEYRTRYGISLAIFDAMLAAQNGKCAICRTDKPGGQGGFHVDHDHATGKVRGLLCSNCNTKFGWLETNWEGINTYLAQHMAA